MTRLQAVAALVVLMLAIAELAAVIGYGVQFAGRVEALERRSTSPDMFVRRMSDGHVCVIAREPDRLAVACDWSWP